MLPRHGPTLATELTRRQMHGTIPYAWLARRSHGRWHHKVTHMLTMRALTTTLAADPLASLPAEDREALAMLGPDVILAKTDIAPIAATTDWLPLVDSANTYVRTSGDNTGKNETITLHGAISPPSEWTMQDLSRWTRYLKPSNDGMHVPASISIPHAVISHFDPPQPLLLPGAMPGQVVQTTITVRVYDIHDPTVLAHSGSLTAHYRDLGAFRIKVPAGTYDTRLIKITYEGKVGPAHVSDSSWAFYAQGVGPVALVNHKDISAFIIYNKDERYGAVLESSTKAVATKAATSSPPS